MASSDETADHDDETADHDDETADHDGETAGVVHAQGGTIGRFSVDGMIGAGGVGIVLSARDPELDRRVAIKVLRAGPGGGGRLIREAQAMARIAHPNAVTIYEVGRSGDELFIAMEYVEGVSLRRWLAARTRSWREIVAMFIATGRGLAAMHSAGLVHRDFKPDNVMVRSDGRPQVGDFGLAADGVAPEVDQLASASRGTSLTVRGEIVGTPSVMAPEQWRGEPVDARADQFAFAVSLWTALFAEPPFAGDDVASLREAVLEDRRRPRPRRSLPHPIVSALERSLARDASDRWPRLDLLLARLERGLGARRRRVIAASAVAVVVSTAAVLAVAMSPAPDPCPLPAAQLDAVWSDARARDLRAHVLAIDPAQGRSRLAAAMRAIDPYLASWRTLRVETCRATRVRGAQSDTLLDLRLRCLDGRLAELAASLGFLRSAGTPEQLDATVRGLFGLTPVSACRNDDALVRLMTLPTDPVRRAAVLDVTARTINLEAAYNASRLVGLEPQVATLVADARKAGHAPALARALKLAADLANARDERDADVAYLRELTQVAAVAGDARTEASAWLALLSSNGRYHRDEALAQIPAASAAVLRAGDPVDLHATLLRIEAELQSLGGGAQMAATKLAEARRLIDAAPERTPALDLILGAVLYEMGTTASDLGAPTEAAVHYHAAIEVFRRVLGPDSRQESEAWHNLGDILFRARRYDEAFAAVQETMRITRARVGESARLASNLSLKALLLDDTGRNADAIATFQEAVAMFRAHVDRDDVAPAVALVGLAQALSRADRVADAEAAYDEVIGLYERTHAQTVNLPIAIFNRAELARRHDRCRDAVPLYQRATTLFAAQKGETSPYLVYPLVGEASCQVALGNPARAIPLLERALALRGDDALRAAMARAWLGRARFESGRDRRGGLAMARAARTAMAAITNDVEAPGELRELDRWLTAR